MESHQNSLRSTGKTHDLVPSALSMFVGTLDDSILGPTDPRVPPADLRLPCGPWRYYVSKGFRAVDHRELAIALAGPESGFPSEWERDVVRFLSSMYVRAKNGHRLHPASRVILTDFCGLDTCGFAFIEPPSPMRDVLPEGSLLALLLNDEECAAAEASSVFRVLTWLGRAYRNFPFPSVCDPRRRSVAALDWQGTVLGKVPQILWAIEHAALSLQRRDNLVLHLKSDSPAITRLSSLTSALGADVPLAVITGPVAGADAMLVWRTHPDHEAIAITGSPGNIIEGRFLLLGRADGPTKALHAEDGFIVALGPDAWMHLEHSFREQVDFDSENASPEGCQILKFSVKFV